MTIGFKAANEYINENTLVVAVDFNNPSQAMNKNIITEKLSWPLLITIEEPITSSLLFLLMVSIQALQAPQS